MKRNEPLPHLTLPEVRTWICPSSGAAAEEGEADHCSLQTLPRLLGRGSTSWASLGPEKVGRELESGLNWALPVKSRNESSVIIRKQSLTILRTDANFGSTEMIQAQSLPTGYPQPCQKKT